MAARMSYKKLQTIFTAFACKLWTSGDLGESMPWASDDEIVKDQPHDAWWTFMHEPSNAL